LPIYRIPVEALVEAEGPTGYVFTISDSLTAKKIKVNIARISSSSAAVSYVPGIITTVVTDGAAYITEGERVTIVK
jgi:hypothetical protein